MIRFLYRPDPVPVAVKMQAGEEIDKLEILRHKVNSTQP
jgi:hypothetical protein